MKISLHEVLNLILSFALTKAFTQVPLQMVVQQINNEFHMDLNVLVNFNACNDGVDTNIYHNLLTTSHKPLIVFNNLNTTTVTPIYQLHNRNLLIIVCLNGGVATWNDTIEFLDQLLWKLHWTEILFVQEMQQNNTFHMQHLQLFQQCWLKGFINVLLWHGGYLYTYHPFPQIEMKQLLTVKAYANKNHLTNFQGYELYLPLALRAPRVYYYNNRQGNEVRTGYWYKMIVFIEQYNGTVNIQRFNLMETQTVTDITKILSKYRYDFVPSIMYFNDYYSHSDVFYLGKVIIICSTPKEIPQALYLLLIFDPYVWLMCAFTFASLALLAAVIYRFRTEHWNFQNACLHAFTTMLNISSNFIKQHTFLIFIIQFMALVTGFLLTNFHACNLSSVLTVKLYEPELKTLDDIMKTDKMILDSVVDINKTLNQEAIPDFIKKRMATLDNDNWQSFDKLRYDLNISAYFYIGMDDLVDYLLFQQIYLARPFATTRHNP